MAACIRASVGEDGRYCITLPVICLEFRIYTDIPGVCMWISVSQVKVSHLKENDEKGLIECSLAKLLEHSSLFYALLYYAGIGEVEYARQPFEALGLYINWKQ